MVIVNMIIIDLDISEKVARSMSTAEMPILSPSPLGFPITQLPRVTKFCCLFDISPSSVMISVFVFCFVLPLYFSKDFMLPIIATIINVSMLSISVGAILAKMTKKKTFLLPAISLIPVSVSFVVTSGIVYIIKLHIFNM